MSLNIRWASLLGADGPEGTASDALRALINQKLQASMPAPLKSLRITHFEFGPTAPLVELTEIGSSRHAQQTDFEEGEFADLPTSVRNAALAQQHHNDLMKQHHQANHSQHGGGGQTPDWCRGFDIDDSVSSSSAAGPWRQDSTAFAPEDAEDIIGEFVGSDGLSMGVHLRYGGGIALQGELELEHSVDLSPLCTVGAGLPIGFTVRDVAIDTLIVVDIYRDTARVWLEPGGGPGESPITRMDVCVTLGQGDDAITPQVVGDLVAAEAQAALMATLCEPQCLEFRLPAPDRAATAAADHKAGAFDAHVRSPTTPFPTE